MTPLITLKIVFVISNNVCISKCTHQMLSVRLGLFAIYVDYLLESVCQNQSLNELHYISMETVKTEELVTGIEGVGCWIHFLDSLIPR